MPPSILPPARPGRASSPISCKWNRRAAPSLRQHAQRTVVSRAMPHPGVRRRTVSRLWLKMSGLAASTFSTDESLVVEIRHQHFNDNPRVHLAHLLNGPPEMFRAAVLQIIPRHRRDDDVPQPHPARRLGHAHRLVGLQRQRFGRADRAKAAGARAAVAGDHERRRALFPSIPNGSGTSRFRRPCAASTRSAARGCARTCRTWAG